MNHLNKTLPNLSDIGRDIYYGVIRSARWITWIKTFLDLSDIGRYIYSWFRRIVDILVGCWLYSDVCGEVESGDDGEVGLKVWL